jgi:SAM-dependent methyltransferase
MSRHVVQSEAMPQHDTEAQRAFYAEAYQASRYGQHAAHLHLTLGTLPRLSAFIAAHGLQHARALEVGSGNGVFQDVIADYTGIDLSPTVADRYHKPFFVGSATALPFPDRAFGLVFSFYVLEHVPNPELALSEMRRVIRPGGYLYLEPSWNCSRFMAQGYPVRPYGDFGWRGKAIKAIAPIVESAPVRAAHVIPRRLWRAALSKLGPTRLRYTRLTPNYEHFWMHDSDAVNGLDRAEVANWFRSRGDTCVNCPDALHAAVSRAAENWLIVRVTS